MNINYLNLEHANIVILVLVIARSAISMIKEQNAINALMDIIEIPTVIVKNVILL